MKAETKVGLMFIGAIVLIVSFGFLLGSFNPFSNTFDINVAYNFAGGIEVGSPVRVMGIKVGKVKEILFLPHQKMPDGEEVKLRIRIQVNKYAWETIREDSEFFINLAGVIGEKFLEVTPGSLDKPVLKPSQLVRGEDPPRIDQLISQSYGLAGKIFDFVENNEGSVIDTINMINNLVTNLNKVLKQMDKMGGRGDVHKLIKNMMLISSDLSYFTQNMRTEDGERTMKLIKKLIWRLEALDGKQIRKFLQEEGIKAKLF